MRFVLFSDIHFLQGNAAANYNQARILRSLEKDIMDVCSEFQVDAIVINGDIAFSGGADTRQYEMAKLWILNLQKALRCRPESFLCVPGNHDVDRTIFEKSALARLFHRSVPSSRDQAITLLENEKERYIITDKFIQFREFVQQFHTQPPWGDEPSLFWSVRREVNGRILAIIGVNSALFSGEEDGPGNLFVSERQLFLLTEVVERADAVVVLCHHPLAELIDGSQLGRIAESKPAIVITGHNHEVSIRSERRESGSFISIQAGSTHRPSNEAPAHNYFVVEFGENLESVRVWPRAWNASRQTWTAASEHFEGLDSRGKLSFPWLAPVTENGSKPIASTPHSLLPQSDFCLLANSNALEIERVGNQVSGHEKDLSDLFILLIKTRRFRTVAGYFRALMNRTLAGNSRIEAVYDLYGEFDVAVKVRASDSAVFKSDVIDVFRERLFGGAMTIGSPGGMVSDVVVSADEDYEEFDVKCEFRTPGASSFQAGEETRGIKAFIVFRNVKRNSLRRLVWLCQEAVTSTNREKRAMCAALVGVYVAGSIVFAEYFIPCGGYYVLGDVVARIEDAIEGQENFTKDLSKVTLLAKSVYESH